MFRVTPKNEMNTQWKTISIFDFYDRMKIIVLSMVIIIVPIFLETVTNISKKSRIPP